jgi:hypothetical protein
MCATNHHSAFTKHARSISGGGQSRIGLGAWFIDLTYRAFRPVACHGVWSQHSLTLPLDLPNTRLRIAIDIILVSEVRSHSQAALLRCKQ